MAKKTNLVVVHPRIGFGSLTLGYRSWRISEFVVIGLEPGDPDYEKARSRFGLALKEIETPKAPEPSSVEEVESEFSVEESGPLAEPLSENEGE